MTGHASGDELKLVKQLEVEVKVDSSPLEDLLHLGILYIEPCHREVDAIRLFESILRRDPRHGTAKVWLAYCYLHYLMDPESLRRAVVILETVISDDPKLRGAAYMLLAEVLDDLGDLSADRRIGLLQASVTSEPDWVYNRHRLGWAYKKVGRYSEALSEIERALNNVRSPNPGWDAATRQFEVSITGRASHRIGEYLEAELKELSNLQTEGT